MGFEEQEAVQRRAYGLWQVAGYPEGRALEHWLQAERELGLPPGATQPPLEAPIEVSMAGAALDEPPAPEARSRPVRRPEPRSQG